MNLTYILCSNHGWQWLSFYIWKKFSRWKIWTKSQNVLELLSNQHHNSIKSLLFDSTFNQPTFRFLLCIFYSKISSNITIANLQHKNKRNQNFKHHSCTHVNIPSENSIFTKQINKNCIFQGSCLMFGAFSEECPFVNPITNVTANWWRVWSMGRGPVLRTPDDWDGGCTQLLSSGPGPAYQDRNQPPHSHTTSEPSSMSIFTGTGV